MTEKEFLYAAECNGGEKALKKAKEYIKEHPKDDYECDDWVAVFHSESDHIMTGDERPLRSPMFMNGTYCYTTRQWP